MKYKNYYIFKNYWLAIIILFVPVVGIIGSVVKVNFGYGFYLSIILFTGLILVFYRIHKSKLVLDLKNKKLTFLEYLYGPKTQIDISEIKYISVTTSGVRVNICLEDKNRNLLMSDLNIYFKNQTEIKKFISILMGCNNLIEDRVKWDSWLVKQLLAPER